MLGAIEIDAVMRDLKTGFYHSQNSSALRDLVHYWSDEIGVLEGPDESLPQVAKFGSFLEKIKLKGLGELPVLILGEDSAETRRALIELVNQTQSGRNLALVLCVTDSSYRYARNSTLIPPGRFVILPRDEIRAILLAPQPLDRLKRQIRSQIPLRKLIPFSISEPAEGLMFVGRQNELDTLVNEEQQDFALCGPGGMGKSSLLRQTIWLLRRQRNARFERVVEVGLIACKTDVNAAAQEIARRVSSTKFASELTLYGLESFLRRIKAIDPRFASGPIDLFIDEIDAVLMADRAMGDSPHTRYPLMRTLRHARSAGLIRLTISGRAETRRLFDDPDNPFVVDAPTGNSRLCRLKLVPLTPLVEKESESLLLESLEDLGVDVVKHRDHLLARVRECAGIPVAIQNLGLDLANAAITGQYA